MTTQRLLTIGLIALVITVLLAVGGALFKSQDTILSTSSVPSSTTEASSGGYEIINGITVPPEPDPEVNNATLAGVDSNSNGVRDDVERVIADKWPTEFVAGLMVAKHTQLLLSQRGSTIDPALEKAAFCALAMRKIDEGVFMLTILNTEERRSAYQANVGIMTTHDCRDEDKSSFLPTTEIINGIAVPPEPDPEVNNATLAGVDVNNNGVRDDVERMIVKRYGADEKARNAGMLSARARQQLLVADKTNRDAAISALKSSGAAGLCAGNAFDASGRNSTEELAYTYAWTYNTEARLDAKASISARAGSYSQTVTSIVCD